MDSGLIVIIVIVVLVMAVSVWVWNRQQQAKRRDEQVRRIHDETDSELITKIEERNNSQKRGGR